MKLPSRDLVFYLESSLRGLAKWLRFLGYKAEFAQHRIDLKTVLENREKFFLITSEETARMLEKAGANFLLLPRDNLKAQIKRLLNKLNLDPELKLDICTVCGVDLIPVNKEDYKEKIPPKAYELYDEFNLCPSCGRVYWEGDHVQRIKEKWKELTN